MSESSPAGKARQLLAGTHAQNSMVLRAQVWATLAVAEAIDRRTALLAGEASPLVTCSCVDHAHIGAPCVVCSCPHLPTGGAHDV